MKTKTCTKCKRELPLNAFGNHRGCPGGLSYWCKECCRKNSARWRATPSGIYTSIRSRQKFDNKTKYFRPFEITRNDFVQWYGSQEKKCAYCDIPEELLNKVEDIYNDQILRLTIDCKDNELGYTLDNIVLACKRCNSIKSDNLSFDEMYEFSQKYLKPKWMEKIQSIQGSVNE